MTITRFRLSSVALAVLGVALLVVAIGCATEGITGAARSLPGHPTLRVAHPVRYGFMYLWFAAIAFFAAWFTSPQEPLRS
jgi:hypothetical protein